MTKRLALYSLLIGLLTVLGFGLFRLSKSRTFQFFGSLTARVETGQKVVALTFDDAPTDYSDSVLQVLADKQVKATFYAIGQNIKKSPEAAKNIVIAGHEIGNHSYSHTRMVLKTPGFIRSEITTTNELIRGLGYTGDVTFRPPYGKKLILLPWYLHQYGMPSVMCDIEPDIYYPNDAQAMAAYVLKNIRPGSIILLHPLCAGCTAAREALPQIIDGLHSQGYRFVRVSELLSMNN